tara:strand:- start:1341 stop:1559 length:219 start_codon:yes stop_codon:yes gene_type:complete
MKVGELREMLNGMSDDLDIVITMTDPTDYTYINGIVSVEEEFLVGGNGEYYTSDINIDGESQEVVVINGGGC